MEISIHRSGKNVWNYNSKSLKKYVKTLGLNPMLLLTIPTQVEIDKIISDYNSSKVAFDEAIKGCELSIDKVNKLIESTYEVSNSQSIPNIKPVNVDVSGTGKFKDWLLGNSNEVQSRISGVKDANVEWITNNLPQDKDSIQIIADFITSCNEFIEKCIWCMANPITALYNFIAWIDPVILIICLAIMGFGFVLYVLTDDKFLGKKPSQYIKSPIIFYIAFKALMYIISIFA